MNAPVQLLADRDWDTWWLATAGAIVKGGLLLEQLGAATTVVLDKTGTLTLGEPQVQAIVSCRGVKDVEMLDVAASAQLRSEYPLGKMIVAAAVERGRAPTEAEQFRHIPGRGIFAVYLPSVMSRAMDTSCHEHSPGRHATSKSQDSLALAPDICSLRPC